MGDWDLAAAKRMFEGYRTSFPDIEPTLLAICAEGDSVCTYWRCTGTHQKPFLDAAPTGKKLTVEGMSFDHYRNGKIVESASQYDALALLMGVGLIPQLPQLPLPPLTAGPERRPHA
jgi:predicted ester cyclase